jgi:hypothetical protein
MECARLGSKKEKKKKKEKKRLPRPRREAANRQSPAKMACCRAPVEQDAETMAQSKVIDTQIKQDRRDEANRITLLLLGPYS